MSIEPIQARFEPGLGLNFSPVNKRAKLGLSGRKVGLAQLEYILLLVKYRFAQKRIGSKEK